MSTAPRPAAHAENTRTAEPGRPRVLLVDDEDMLLRAWGRQLEHAGLEVSMARSARDAVGALVRAGGEFDAIICDLHMPDGGGIDLYRFVEAQYPGLQHRVVFITGGVFSTTESELLRVTGQPVLEKPGGIEKLAAIVRDWAARRRAGLGPRKCATEP